jgi:hypothetical protein
MARSACPRTSSWGTWSWTRTLSGHGSSALVVARSPVATRRSTVGSPPNARTTRLRKRALFLPLGDIATSREAGPPPAGAPTHATRAARRRRGRAAAGRAGVGSLRRASRATRSVRSGRRPCRRARGGAGGADRVAHAYGPGQRAPHPSRWPSRLLRPPSAAPPPSSATARP